MEELLDNYMVLDKISFIFFNVYSYYRVENGLYGDKSGSRKMRKVLHHQQKVTEAVV